MARILCIEDDEHIQHLVGQVLYQHGYDVHSAWNGREGYEKALSLDPDLIVLDLMLPIMNGVQFLKALRRHETARDIPIIVVTAYGDEAGLLKCSIETLASAHYLRKPIDFTELLNCVKRVLAAFPRARRGLQPRKELRKGVIRADPRLRTVWVDDRLAATLVHKEFAVLECLMRSPGPVPRGELLSALGYQDGQANALAQTVHRLRRHLGPANAARISTTPEGYEVVG
ncbi:MAG: response regulator transcription factor [Elusimicrobia bacterium]|nr:response regulator transcription factor [Elusimicrobiota bacterium]